MNASRAMGIRFVLWTVAFVSFLVPQPTPPAHAADDQNPSGSTQPAGESAKSFENPTPGEKDSELILRMAAQSEANFRRILTWTARYQLGDYYPVTKEWATREGVEKSLTGHGPWHREDRGVVEFAFDATLDKVYTEIEMQSAAVYADADGTPLQAPVRISGQSQQHSILDGNRYLFIHPNETYGVLLDLPNLPNMRGRVAFREAPEKAAELRYSMVVDPRHLFAYNRPFWEELRVFAAMSTAHGKKTVDVRRLPESTSPKYLVIVNLKPQLDAPPDHTIRVEIVCDSDAQYNFESLQIQEHSGTVRQSYSWEYRGENGIIVPTKLVRTNVLEDGRRVQTRRILQLLQSTMNKPIPPSTFTIEQFGLRDGERFVDFVDRVGYVMQGGKLVEAAKFSARRPLTEFGQEPAVADDPVGRRRVIFAMISVGLLLCIVGILAYRKLR